MPLSVPDMSQGAMAEAATATSGISGHWFLDAMRSRWGEIRHQHGLVTDVMPAALGDSVVTVRARCKCGVELGRYAMMDKDQVGMSRGVQNTLMLGWANDLVWRHYVNVLLEV